MEAVVAPFDQRYDVPADELKVTELPAQKVVGPPAEIVGVAGGVPTVTVVPVLELERHPAALVT